VNKLLKNKKDKIVMIQNEKMFFANKQFKNILLSQKSGESERETCFSTQKHSHDVTFNKSDQYFGTKNIIIKANM